MKQILIVTNQLVVLLFVKNAVSTIMACNSLTVQLFLLKHVNMKKVVAES